MSPSEIYVADQRISTAEPRMLILDGLRGIAALAVLVSHIAPSICHLSVLRSWFAVDLFFMISGCVLCRVYEPRFKAGLSPSKFMQLRYLRLYPLFGVGIAIGVVAEVINVLQHSSLFSDWARLEAVASGLLILPSLTAHFTPEIIPLNPVGWSLFFELFINLVYAVFWRRLSTRALYVVIAVAGLDPIWLSAHNLSFGGTGWPSFWGGFPRVSFAFFAGVLMGRAKRAPARTSNWAWAPMLAFVGLLVLPWEDAHLKDTIVLILALPPLIWCALSFEPHSAPPFALLGALSYPVYAIHYPLYRVFGLALGWFGVSPEMLAPWSGIAFIALVIGIASVLERFFDVPVRRAMSNSFARSRGTSRCSAQTFTLPAA